MHRSSIYLVAVIILQLLCCGVEALENYTVHFEGKVGEELRRLLQGSSQLIAQKKYPPATAAALRRRGLADIPRLMKALRGRAYYDAHIDLHIDLDTDPVSVIFNVDPGSRFTLEEFSIRDVDQCAIPLSLSEIGITLGSYAYPRTILAAEEALMVSLAEKGYPLAVLEGREVVADVARHTVKAVVTLKRGPLAYFGKANITGNRKVSEAFFCKKIAWCIGERYRPDRLEQTQSAMEASALFSSIAISPADSVGEDGLLPINVEVVESKHQSLGFGLGYSTQQHVGALLEYENRNMRQMGERLALRSTIWSNTRYDGTFFYLVPDWGARERDLIWLLEACHEITEGYTESSVSASIAVEQQVHRRLRASYGLKSEFLRNTDSDNNGNFNLLKLPIALKWSHVDDPLDPKRGYSLNYRFIPTLQIVRSFFYCTNILTGCIYLPLRSELTLAAKVTVGSIIGTVRRAIPPSERFYAGSEETLRGYRYMTVSPLEHGKDPIGGRSMIICNFEWRWRFNSQFGGVLFWDIGNVYTSYMPQPFAKQLQAVGLGVRYHTPVGPLRVDVAIPLQPRRRVDHRFEIYLSMGQSF